MQEEFIVKYRSSTYDIAKFLKDHPGGTRILQSYRNKDVEPGMLKYNHSSSAYHLINDFKIDDRVYEELVEANLTGRLSKNGRIITKMEQYKDKQEIEYLEELEGRLDWSEPILSQLHKIQDDYEAWSNSSVYRKMKLFKNPILESLTLTPWWVVPLFWIPIISYLGISQFKEHVLCNYDCSNKLSKLEFSMHIASGACIWTILEYCLHRWIFHMNPGKSLRMITMNFLIHGLHHKVPFDGMRQVFPPVPASILAFILYGSLQYMFQYPRLQLTGGLMGYLIYDMIHYYVHHGSPKDGSYLYTMKRYHSNHHFVNHDKAFGISSKLWDYVFRTLVHLRKLGFSLHWS